MIGNAHSTVLAFNLYVGCVCPEPVLGTYRFRFSVGMLRDTHTWLFVSFLFGSFLFVQGGPGSNCDSWPGDLIQSGKDGSLFFVNGWGNIYKAPAVRAGKRRRASSTDALSVLVPSLSWQIIVVFDMSNEQAERNASSVC